MLQLQEREPDELILRQLQQWQREVDAAPDYAAQVEKAQAAWKSHRSTQPMTAVKALLAQMCCGGIRCVYCEDSRARDIEHIWPKSLYPERVFQWRNYLYACDRCNGNKGAQFAVFPASGGPLQVVSRVKGQVASARPLAGDPVFIDPRCEDPTRFIQLDLVDTFRLEPVPGLADRDKQRAEYTRDKLALNDPGLCQERHSDYGNFLARLKEYLADRQDGAPAERLMRRRQALLKMRHQTVWFEMKRQQAKIPDLAALFAQAPEALQW